jgi:hypothetical protein
VDTGTSDGMRLVEIAVLSASVHAFGIEVVSALCGKPADHSAIERMR